MQTVAERTFAGRRTESWDYHKNGDHKKGSRDYAYFTDPKTLECLEYEVPSGEVAGRVQALSFGSKHQIVFEPRARGFNQLSYVLISVGDA